MTTYLQEFFSSSESKKELESKLISSGFKENSAREIPNSFETKNVFISLQENSSKKGSIVEAPHDYCFVLELYKPLEKFDKNSPLFKFFKSLEQPYAHGIRGFEPKYKIKEYLKN